MFEIIKIYSDVKKGVKDPTALGQDLALDVIKGPLLLFSILAGLFFLVLILVGFTTLLGGPYIFIKIVFWILFVPSFFIFSVLWMLLGRIKKMMDKARKQMTNREKIIDVEIQG